MAAKIARQPGVALQMTKFAVDGGLNMDLKSAIAYEARCFELLFSTTDQKEGMRHLWKKEGLCSRGSKYEEGRTKNGKRYLSSIARAA